MNLKRLDADIESFLSADGRKFYRRLLEFSPFLDASNQMVIIRMGYNDHGLIHSKIITLYALHILDILKEKVPLNIVKENLGTYGDVQLVVMAGAFLHDVGNMVHRKEHIMHSCYLTAQLLHPVLPDFTARPVQMLSEILHCVYSHHEDTHCLTTEAGIVKVADGCDMAEGRARIPYHRGKVDIHSVSALSIKKVTLSPGVKKPLKIEVRMDSQAGIFQIQEVLGAKARTSGLMDYLEIVGIHRNKTLPITL
ncbi:MAG: HD domain-containing protein [Theionarchaea archaeon]|nr:HD domain-containing protein [Theionarchaea archaeon]MBU7037679.1 HD domain-containing protein [Theionarchaea archaeon]